MYEVFITFAAPFNTDSNNREYTVFFIVKVVPFSFARRFFALNKLIVIVF